jgi:hypothetical protein
MRMSSCGWALLFLSLWAGCRGASAESAVPEKTPDSKKNSKTLPKPAPENPNAPASVEGTYYIPTEKNGQATLQLRSDGVFALTAGNGTLHEGIYRYMKGWLSIDSGFHRREFMVEKDPAGLKVARMKQDKAKSGDPIGELRPQKGENEIWRLKDAVVTEAPKVEPKPEVKAPPIPPVPPIVEAPKIEPLAKVEAPKPEEPKVIAKVEPKVEAPPPPIELIKKPEPVPAPIAKVEAPAPTPEPVKEPVKEPKVAVAPVAPKIEKPAPAPEPVKAEEPKADAITGRFRFSANALVTETLVLRKDGAFIYKDSNGVAVAGYYQWKGTELQLTAGGMMRLLRASATPTGALVLTKAENSTMKGGGELAYMSPCTRASAQYEKIANE